MTVDYTKGEGDHPRACGEQSALTERSVTSPGSSPRVRGAVIELCRRGVQVGIIPARAGSSRPS